MSDYLNPLEELRRDSTRGATHRLTDEEGSSTGDHHEFYMSGEVTITGRTGAGETEYVYNGEEFIQDPDEEDVMKSKLFWGTRKYKDPEAPERWNALEAAVGLYVNNSPLYDEIDRLYDTIDDIEDPAEETHSVVAEVEVERSGFERFFREMIGEYQTGLDYVYEDSWRGNHERIFDHFFEDNDVMPASSVPQVEGEEELIVTDEGDHLRFIGDANAAVGIPSTDIDRILSEDNPREWMDSGRERDYRLTVSVDVPKEDAMKAFNHVSPAQV